MRQRDFQNVKRIYQAAVERVPEERAAFLAKECNGDDEIRAEVERLLASNKTDFMEAPAIANVAEAIVEEEAADARTEFLLDDHAGKVVSHFRIISKIGEGGLGEVFLANDISLQRKVAIKFLSQEFIQDSDKLNRFVQEAKAASALNHPNILTVFEFGESEGIRFLATEYVEGETLRARLADDLLSLKEVLDISIQMSGALSAAHQAGIVHRDIKPDNVMIRNDGLVKVLDFGLAKLTESSLKRDADLEASTIPKVYTTPGLIMGTPDYMSPEQARGKEIDSRTDIFSFGIVLFELLTGHRPFRGESFTDVLIEIVDKEPPKLSEYASDLPAGFQQIVDRALCKDPDDRYQNFEEVKAELETFQKEDLPDRSGSKARTKKTKRESPATVREEQGQTIQKDAATGKRISWRSISAENVIEQVKGHRTSSLLILSTILVGLIWFLYWQVNPSVYEPSPEARMWYEKGRSAINDGLLLTAKNSFEEAIAKDKDYVMAHAGLAEAYYELGYTNDSGLAKERANEINRSNDLPLSGRDSIRLKAISNTLSLDFPAAVEQYEKLAGNAPANEKANAFLDLGKSYEKAEKIDKALETYKIALKFNSDLAAINLRLAVLQGRLQDYKNSDSFFSKAEELHKIQSNTEGEIEAIILRGLVLSKKGDASEALEGVKDAAEKARINELPNQETKCLSLVSRLLRSSSRTKEALPYAEKAVSIARRAGFQNLHATALKEVGTVHFFLGANDKAAEFYTEALGVARKSKIELVEKRVLLQLGAFSIQQHKADKALEYIDQVQTYFEKSGYKKDVLDALSIKGQALAIKGEYKAALELYKDQYKKAEAVGDQVIRARAKKGIGTMYANMDRLSEALPALYESYSIYNSINQNYIASFSLLAHADVSLQLGDYKKAKSSLNLAEGIAETHKQLVPRTDVLRARIALSERNLSEAIKVARKAIDEDKSGKMASTFEAKTILALALTYEGNKVTGRMIIEKLFEGEIEEDDLQATARAYLIHSEIMLKNGLFRKAKESATETQEILKQLGKPSLEWQAWTLLSRAQNKLNESDMAKISAAKADEIYSTLYQKWKSTDLELYSKRKDVRDLIVLSNAE